MRIATQCHLNTGKMSRNSQTHLMITLRFRWKFEIKKDEDYFWNLWWTKRLNIRIIWECPYNNVWIFNTSDCDPTVATLWVWRSWALYQAQWQYQKYPTATELGLLSNISGATSRQLCRLWLSSFIKATMLCCNQLTLMYF